MVHGVRLLVVSILLVVGCGQNARRNTFEVTYIANKGFLITMGDTKVLVDAAVWHDNLAEIRTMGQKVWGGGLKAALQQFNLGQLQHFCFAGQYQNVALDEQMVIGWQHGLPAFSA